MSSKIICGPSGGIGGLPFDDQPPLINSGVREIRIWSGSYIDAIQIVLDIDGEPVEYPKHGGSNGNFSVFGIEDGDYICEVYGRYGSYIESLNFRTSQGHVRRFGGQGGITEFLYVTPPDYQIIGFWGRSGSLLDSLGIHMCRI